MNQFFIGALGTFILTMIAERFFGKKIPSFLITVLYIISGILFLVSLFFRLKNGG